VVSHPWQLDFVASVKDKHPEFFSNTKVLEVGSLDINGSIRMFFSDCDYTGVDLGPGRGVDLIGKGEELPCPDGSLMSQQVVSVLNTTKNGWILSRIWSE
jgi:hypothetical protein